MGRRESYLNVRGKLCWGSVSLVGTGNQQIFDGDAFVCTYIIRFPASQGETVGHLLFFLLRLLSKKCLA